MVNLRRVFLIMPCMIASLTACAGPPPPRSVYQDHRTVIQLHVDPQAGTGHSHPARFSQEQMVKILAGLRVQPDRYAVHRLFAGDAEPRPAFGPEEVWSLASHVVKALASAKPDEIVTFYRRVSDASTGLSYTTGGLFLRGDYLYVILANYRQWPSDAMALGIPAHEIDPVDDPLLPLRRAGYSVSFVPEEAEVHPVQGQWTRRFPDPAKMVIVNPSLVLSHSPSEKDKANSQPSR